MCIRAWWLCPPEGLKEACVQMEYTFRKTITSDFSDENIRTFEAKPPYLCSKKSDVLRLPECRLSPLLQKSFWKKPAFPTPALLHTDNDAPPPFICQMWHWQLTNKETSATAEVPKNKPNKRMKRMDFTSSAQCPCPSCRQTDLQRSRWWLGYSQGHSRFYLTFCSFFSALIFSTYKSTPSMVAVKSSSCAINTLTVGSISPLGGRNSAKKANTKAAKKRYNCKECFSTFHYRRGRFTPLNWKDRFRLSRAVLISLKG